MSYRKKGMKFIQILLVVLLTLGQPLAVLALDLDEDTELTIRSLVASQYYEMLGEDMMTYELDKLLEGLDLYSGYLSKESYATFEEDLEGLFGGLGVRIATTANGIAVVGVLPKTPAEKAGLMIDDLFVAVDGKDVQDISQEEIVSLLRGEIGSQVLLTLKDKNGDLRDLRLTRELIDVSEKEALVDADGIGYVRITSFGQETGGWFYEELEKMQGQGLKGLIIDLRGNHGGSLNSALSMASAVLAEEEIIANLYSRGQKINSYYSKTGSLDLPVVVLANGNSASASELLMAALRGNHRAVLVGEKSFGKGVIQSLFKLPNEGRLKLTTSEYKGPNDEPIHGRGVSPDFWVLQDEEDMAADNQLRLATRWMKEKLEQAPPAEIKFVVGTDTLKWDDVDVSLVASPIMTKGSFQVGLRDFMQVLGYDVGYLDGRIIAKDANHSFSFTEGKRAVLMDKQTIALPQPLIVQEGRSYLPLRYLADSLGYQVKYDPQTAEILVIR